jgi:hypothetical protein
MSPFVKLMGFQEADYGQALDSGNEQRGKSSSFLWYGSQGSPETDGDKPVAIQKRFPGRRTESRDLD